MKRKKFYLITATTLLSLGIVGVSDQKVHAEKIALPNLPLQYNKNKNLKQENYDPLLDGKYVSNGYIDDGYTYLNPTAMSPERQNSYHLNVDKDWSNDLQTIIYNKNTQEYQIYYFHTSNVSNNDTGKQQNWDMVTTKDFIHFSKPTIALKDLSNDIGDAWSSAWTGTIIENQGNIIGVPKGAKVAYFSGLR